MISHTQYRNYFHAIREFIQQLSPAILEKHSLGSLQEVLNVVVIKFAEILQAKGALIRILNEDTNQFEVRAAFGIGTHYLSKGPVTPEKVLPDVTNLNKVYVVSDIWHSSRVEYPKEAWDEGIRMMIDVPIAICNQAVGMIRIYLSEPRVFSDIEQDFILAVAEQVACVIERIKSVEKQQVQFDYLATRMEKMSSLGRMAAGIAHEINNPLAGILLYSSNLRKKVPPGSALEEGMNIIIQETQRCKTIIQGLLEFARDKEPEKVESDINDIVETALGIVENEFRCQHVRVEKKLAEDMVKTFLDKNQIQQVFINLLLNALEAVDENGRVSVHSASDLARKRVTIEIADTGCGIAPEHLKHIFEPFFSTKANGTGLGLSISYGIINNHQGDIRVFSVPGKGARFTVELPILVENDNRKKAP
jgi:two-component system, NtrC family, sensor kinase